MYILNNVYLGWWFSNEHVLWKGRLNVSLQEHTYIDHCTYSGFGLLAAPHEHVLHGPLLGIYWLRLCSHFGAPMLEATLLRRRMFIALMTAAHISPNVFSLQPSLASVYCTSYYNTSNARLHITHYIHTSYITLYYIISYFITHLRPSWVFISSVLPIRLAALGSLGPIQIYSSKPPTVLFNLMRQLL